MWSMVRPLHCGPQVTFVSWIHVLVSPLPLSMGALSSLLLLFTLKKVLFTYLATPSFSCSMQDLFFFLSCGI